MNDMSCIDWFVLVVGAILGAFIGLIVSIAWAQIMKERKRQEFVKKVNPYLGIYKVKNVENPQIKEVEITYDNGIGELVLNIDTVNNGPANGIILLDKTWRFGTSHYFHTDEGKSHLSGKYDFHFLKPGNIKGTVLYYDKKKRDYVVYEYTFQKDKNA